MDSVDIVATAIGTGASSAVITIAALRVHILYLREAVAELKATVTRAHTRIDELQKQIG